MSRYLVIGATSAIARACCREWLLPTSRAEAEDPPLFFLVGRDAEKLEHTAVDLLGRGASGAKWVAMDLLDIHAHGDILEEAESFLGGIEVVLVAHGTLPDQNECEVDAEQAVREFSLNATVTISLLNRTARIMTERGRGVIAAITSVAGDRGRPSNYVYGSAKAAVSVFCEGLRARVFRNGVHVIDIRPGFVDTPMTRGLNLPRLLVAAPDMVARRIVRGIRRRKDVLYVPGYWALILWVIRNIPSPIFKRMSL